MKRQYEQPQTTYFRLCDDNKEEWKSEPDASPPQGIKDELARQLIEAAERTRDKTALQNHPMIRVLEKFGVPNLDTWPLRLLFHTWASDNEKQTKLCATAASILIDWLMKHKQHPIDTRVMHIFFYINYRRVGALPALQARLLSNGTIHWRTLFCVLCDGKYIANDIGWILDHLGPLEFKYRDAIVHGTLFLSRPGKFETWSREGRKKLTFFTLGLSIGRLIIDDDDKSFFNLESYDTRREQFTRFKYFMRHRSFQHYLLEPYTIALLVRLGEGDYLLEYLKERMVGHSRKSVKVIYRRLAGAPFSNDIADFMDSFGDLLGIPRRPPTPPLSAEFDEVLGRLKRTLFDYETIGYSLW